MIKIKISENQMERISEIWFKWFIHGNRISEFIDVLDHDPIYRNMIFKSNIEYSSWKNEYQIDESVKKDATWREPIQKYIFADLSDESVVVKKYKKRLQKKTIEFLISTYKKYRETTTIVKIINILKIDVCPYCNRNFMENYSYKKKKYFKGDLDHHYSKDEIPALAIAFYNLVPSCKVCNHEKSDTTERTFFPFYDDEEKEYRFKIELYDDKVENDIITDTLIKDIESKRYDSTVWQGISDNFNIRLRGVDKSELNECMMNSKEVFRLEKKYNHSKEYVREIIRKTYIYPQTHKSILLNHFSEIFGDETALLESFFSYYDDEKYLYSRPLSKLTKDILRQLGVL